jgi:hypothetical protein
MTMPLMAAPPFGKVIRECSSYAIPKSQDWLIE